MIIDRALSPVNNHYLLNTLPFPSTECRKGAWRGRNNYLGLFFKDLQNGKQGNQLRKNMKYPLYSTLPRHTQKAEKYTHTPLFISTVSKEETSQKKKPGVFWINTSIFNPLNVHTYTCTSLTHPPNSSI